jgi:hypothetical protein
MIVSDDTVSKALQYLSEDPHPLANAEKAVLFAEKDKNETFAELYLETKGTVKERESQVIIEPAFQAALTTEIEAQAERKRHKQRSEAAEKIIDIWRTQNANVRAAERLR